MALLKGITVTLEQKTLSGTDPFGANIYTVEDVPVGNVLVYPASAEDIASEINITGKHIVYNLCIPKGDEHIWEDTNVTIRGKKYRTVGIAKEYIEALTPLLWNKQISVELYE